MNVKRPETLLQRTVEALREALLEGTLGPILPGEHRLCSDLGVSRRTLRQALIALEKEGTVSESKRGKPRRVLLKPSPSKKPVEQSKTVAVLLPHPQDALSPGTQDFFRHVEDELRAEGCRFVYHHAQVNDLKRPTARLKVLLAQQPADSWFLYQCSVQVAEFFDSSGIPCTICGGPASDLSSPYSAFDGAATIHHAIGLLARTGHSRIIAPMRHSSPSRIEVMKKEFTRIGVSFSQSQNAPDWGDDTATLARILDLQFARPDRPTAIILNGIDALITLYSVLIRHALRVPEDLSIVVAGSDPMFKHFEPQLTHYTTPHHSLALASAGLIRNQLRTPNIQLENKLLLMDYVAGKSVAPPA